MLRGGARGEVLQGPSEAVHASEEVEDGSPWLRSRGERLRRAQWLATGGRRGVRGKGPTGHLRDGRWAISLALFTPSSRPAVEGRLGSIEASEELLLRGVEVLVRAR